MQQRDVTLSLILTVVTCGLYGLYWMAKVTDDIHALSGKPRTASGVKAVIFTVLTCGLYFFYWVYELGGELIQARLEKGLPHDSVPNSVYLMAAIVSTVLLTAYTFLDIFAEMSAEAGPHSYSTGDALLISLLAGAIVFAIHTAIALVIIWFIYKRSDPSPRVLYIMFAIFRLNMITIAFLQASLNNAILAQSHAPAVNLTKQ